MELAQKTKEMGKVEQIAYDMEQKEIEAHLKSQFPIVCRKFRLWTWIEALNAGSVDLSLELRNPKKVFYPQAIRAQASAPPLTNSAISA